MFFNYRVLSNYTVNHIDRLVIPSLTKEQAKVVAVVVFLFILVATIVHLACKRLSIQKKQVEEEQLRKQEVNTDRISTSCFLDQGDSREAEVTVFPLEKSAEAEQFTLSVKEKITEEDGVPFEMPQRTQEEIIPVVIDLINEQPLVIKAKIDAKRGRSTPFKFRAAPSENKSLI